MVQFRKQPIMKTKAFTPLLAALGAGTLFSALAINATAGEIILHEAIDDYSPVSESKFDRTPQATRSGYQVNIVLDEAYHDYDGSQVMAFNYDMDALEQTEIAAFEYGDTTREKTVFPWVIEALD
jgi:hypothetical protein